MVDGLFDNFPVHILVDSGASENFVDFNLCQKLQLAINGSPTSIGMASSEVSIPTCCIVVATLSFHNRTYPPRVQPGRIRGGPCFEHGDVEEWGPDAITTKGAQNQP